MIGYSLYCGCHLPLIESGNNIRPMLKFKDE